MIKWIFIPLLLVGGMAVLSDTSLIESDLSALVNRSERELSGLAVQGKKDTGTNGFLSKRLLVQESKEKLKYVRDREDENNGRFRKLQLWGVERGFPTPFYGQYQVFSTNSFWPPYGGFRPFGPGFRLPSYPEFSTHDAPLWNSVTSDQFNRFVM